MFRIICAVIIALSLYAPKDALSGDKLRILWLSSLPYDIKTQEPSPFWMRTKYYIEAAAEDLGVEIVHAPYFDDYNLFVNLAKGYLGSNNPPDAVLFHNHKMRGEDVLEIAEEFGVPAFVFNAGFTTDEQGEPRGKYKKWIGEILPDDEFAGFVLMEALAEECRLIHKEGTIQAVAFAGGRDSNPSILRVKGMNRYLNGNKGINMRQIFNTDWDPEKVALMIPPLASRYPEVALYWAASDAIAKTTAEQLTRLGYMPGEDFVTGGMDWLPEVIHMIEDGTLAASVGGHYIEGAWAVILIHDYLKGVDFAETGRLSFKTEMFPLTGSNISEFADLIKMQDSDTVKRIDFKAYSRYYNPDMNDYSFSIPETLKNLKGASSRE
ncbi:ABC transporter substrate-binding protein [Limisalsivibrio acetivorans]|uniref:ABC transporter substrate-binding protein n=1 Tax=Limisalsivibrio acetivorans TaxID=1304888 RepID=UPI0003B32745|nr:ABC transporter substrate-binding protein [Limisalsivibrio acetivorans]